jgi:hypothetical protein
MVDSSTKLSMRATTVRAKIGLVGEMDHESRMQCTPISARAIAWVVDSSAKVPMRVAAVHASGHVGEIVREGHVQCRISFLVIEQHARKAVHEAAEVSMRVAAVHASMVCRRNCP